MRELYDSGGAFMLDEDVPAFLPPDVKAWLGGVVAQFLNDEPRIYIGTRRVARTGLHVLTPTSAEEDLPEARRVRCQFRIAMDEQPDITGFLYVPWDRWREVRAGAKRALDDWGV
jgi:hypothetical protein